MNYAKAFCELVEFLQREGCISSDSDVCDELEFITGVQAEEIAEMLKKSY